MSKFFKPSDFVCKCDRGDKCDAVPFDMTTALKLDGLRLELGEPMIITSGSRCRQHNDKVGGAADSNHLLGIAVDVLTSHRGGHYAARVFTLAIKHGFIGLGVSKGFLHLDCREGSLTIFGY